VQPADASFQKSVDHVCLHCKSSFASKNRLFAHLRNSECTEQAASKGLQVGDRQEKVAVIFGCSRPSADWQPLLWKAIDIARDVGIIPGRKSYAERGGPPGAAFAVDSSDASSGPHACNVLGLMTEPLNSDEQRQAWCAKANGALPSDIRILGRSAGLPIDFHAERTLIRRKYNCALPTQILVSGTGEANTQVGEPSGTDQACSDATIREELPNLEGVWRRKHVRREHDPGWGDSEVGEELLGQFFNLKEILRSMQGERRFHNFSSGSKICPGDAAARRWLYKCRALTGIGHNVTAISISVDALLPGQLRAMAGLAIALQRGLLPDSYLEEAFSEDRLLPVPLVPDGTQYLASSSITCCSL